MNVRRLLHGVLVRRRWARAMSAAGAIVLLASLALAWWRLAGLWFAAFIVFAAIVTALVVRRRPSDLGSAVLLVEERAPVFRNLFISAVEILDGRLPVSSPVSDLVLREADRRAEAIHPSEIVPLRRARNQLVAASIAGALLIPISTMLPSPGVNRPQHSSERTSPVDGATVHLSATATAPAYLGGSVSSWDDPREISVVAGSHLQVAARGGLVAWRSAGDRRSADASFTFAPREDGALVLHRPDGAEVKVVPVTVAADERPAVSVIAPGRDLITSGLGSVMVSGEARDDFGLIRAELRYTRVSGSGEQFEFKEGVLPVRAERISPTHWKLTTSVDVRALRLEAGDMFVYRLAAQDGRENRGEGLSTAYMIEVPGPNAALAGGAEVDPADDKFALSQQMVLLKLQRLHAARRGLAPETLRERALSLAAEQRAVRALVIFMLGGEVEDEEVEAAHSHEIQEGRLEDASRKDLALATTLMSRVERLLIGADTSGALPPAEDAVEALQRAFGRRRYFLRTTPVRMRIDPSRRLSAPRDEAGDATLPPADSGSDDGTRAVIESLLEIAAGLPERGRTASAMASAAAGVLALEPASRQLRDAAVTLQSAPLSDPEAVRRAITSTIVTLTDRARQRRPGAQEPAVSDQLRRAWGAEWRREP